MRIYRDETRMRDQDRDRRLRKYEAVRQIRDLPPADVNLWSHFAPSIENIALGKIKKEIKLWILTRE